MLVRRIRSRVGKSVGVVEVHGEVLFLPGTDLSRWKNRFSQRVRVATAAAAPTNKRPRWSHYGMPLKRTITASTSTRLLKGGGRFYIAVGSSAPHAYYVDQGTGVYGGNGPYEAKVLPPWQRGEASLYEASWRPGGPDSKKVKPVIIRGQKGQRFFDAGLKRGFQSMRLRSFQLPAEGASAMTSALTSFPSGLTNFRGNTASDGAFRAQLAEWRKWRDDAWGWDNSLGRKIRPERPERSTKPTKPAKAKTTKPTKPKPKIVKPQKPKKPKGYETLRDKQNAAVAAFTKQNPNIQIRSRVPAGLVVITARGPYIIPWSKLYNLL